MIINRVWSMPNKHTFLIKPIKELVDKYIHGYSIDPFANECKIANVTNDIDNSYDTSFTWMRLISSKYLLMNQ